MGRRGNKQVKGPAKRICLQGLQMLDLLNLLHHPLISLLLLPILPFMVCLGAAAGQQFAVAPMFPEAAACPCLFWPASLGHGRTSGARTEASDRPPKSGLASALPAPPFTSRSKWKQALPSATSLSRQRPLLFLFQPFVRGITKALGRREGEAGVFTVLLCSCNWESKSLFGRKRFQLKLL